MTPSRLSLIALLPAFFLPSLSSAGELLGTWRPVELDSGNFKQVQFALSNGTLEMRTWSSVNGGEMEARPRIVPGKLTGNEVAAIEPGSKPFTLAQSFGFKNTTYEISLRNNGLHILATDSYTDDSGRGTRKHELSFVRGHYEEALTSNKANDIIESGWLGIWKNRDNSTRGIAQLTIRDLDPVTMSTWGIMGAEIATRPGSTFPLPLDGDTAQAADAEGSIEATTDLGWAKITYKMKLHPDGLTVVTETSYTDPKRRDQKHEYEFVRRAWKE